MPSHENEKKKSEQRRQKVSKDMVCRSANAQGVGWWWLKKKKQKKQGKAERSKVKKIK